MALIYRCSVIQIEQMKLRKIHHRYLVNESQVSLYCSLVLLLLQLNAVVELLLSLLDMMECQLSLLSLQAQNDMSVWCHQQYAQFLCI